MMYVLVQLRDTSDVNAYDKPLRVASSSLTLLEWAKENLGHFITYCDGLSCAPGVVWSAMVKIDGQTTEIACFEVEKI